MGRPKKNIWIHGHPKRRKPLPDNPFAGVLALALAGVVGFFPGALMTPQYAARGNQAEMRGPMLGGAAFAISLGLPGLQAYRGRPPEADEEETEKEQE